MFANIRADLDRACEANQHERGLAALAREVCGNPGTQAVLIYRLGAWIDTIRVPGLRHALKIGYFPLQYLVAFRVGIFIPPKAEIGPGFVIHTWGGGVFLPRTKIGKNLTVIGGGVQMDFDMAGIGDDVDIGPGTKVVGSIRLGSGVRTGPNSVVQADVPDYCVVIGNPGRVIGPIPKLTHSEGGARTVPAAAPRPSAGPSEHQTTGTPQTRTESPA